MGIGALLREFFNDDKVAIALLVVALDFLLGVIVAFKVGVFRLSYISDFLRNDVMFKLLPYFIFYAGAIVAGQAELVIPGLDMGVVAGAAYVALMAAFVGSILNSARELGFVPSMPDALAGGENSAPPKS